MTMKRFVQWRLFLASEQCEASLADHVCFLYRSFLLMFSKLTCSFILQLFIDRILCARNSPKRLVFTSEHSRNNSSLRGIYIPVGNTDIKQ